MKATLIEIDSGVVGQHWYAKHPGMRLWAHLTEYPWWRVLPGQDIPGEADSGLLLIDQFHAWTVREAEVELRLVEIPADAGSPS